MASVTYAFYRDSYGGTLDEGGFSAALPHALAAVRSATWPNDPEERGAEAEYMRAVCAAVDVDAAHGFSGGAGQLASVSVGSVSMSMGGSGGSSSYASDMAAAVGAELVGTGMLYTGIGCGR